MSEFNNVIYLPTRDPETLTPEERHELHMKAAEWEDLANIALKGYEYAQRQRENYLRRLGMLAERGLEG